MNILLIGSGGREHAIAWKLTQSPLVKKLYVAPGNGGISQTAECVLLNIADHAAVIRFCEEKTIGLVFVGPEAPLVAGLVDDLEKAGVTVFGPSRKAAQLEGSKEFTKIICDKYAIPTAAYGSFTDAAAAKAYVRKVGAPIVVKADGLAAGKGVIIAQTVQEAEEAIEEMFGGRFGDAGSKVVIEEFMEGEEISVFALVDGEYALPFGSAQDHKRVGEGDTGPNTGGMGTYAPAPVLTPILHQEILETIIQPTVAGMKKEGIPYKGVLFAGIMVTKQGPKLLEFNCRFGDPETQVLMARLDSDLAELLLAGAKGNLHGKQIAISERAALCVVMAANGYPEDYQKGTEIRGLDHAAALEDVMVFHAGTRKDGNRFLANGGRVLGVTALGDTVLEAQKRAYIAVDKIDWPEGFCRRDIGWRAVERLKKVS